MVTRTKRSKSAYMRLKRGRASRGLPEQGCRWARAMCDEEVHVCTVQRYGKGCVCVQYSTMEKVGGGHSDQQYIWTFDNDPLALTRIRKHQIKMMSAEVKDQRNLRAVRADVLDHWSTRPAPHRGVHTLPCSGVFRAYVGGLERCLGVYMVVYTCITGVQRCRYGNAGV